MDLQLKYKKAFISGSTEGIGYAIAEKLVQEGAEVILNGRSEDKLHHAITKLREKFPDAKVEGIIADFSDATSVNHLIESLPEVDILVNNVGVFEFRNAKDCTDEDWNKNFQINFLSATQLTQKVLEKMISKNEGRILFIGSEYAQNINPDSIQYGVTKAAVSAYANGISKLTKNTKVTVNTILAGATYSEGVAKAIQYFAHSQGVTEEEMKKQFFAKGNPNSLLGRYLDTDEVANVATFLVSPLSLAINGATIRVDAGNNPYL